MLYPYFHPTSFSTGRQFKNCHPRKYGDPEIISFSFIVATNTGNFYNQTFVNMLAY